MFKRIKQWKLLVFEIVETLITLCLFLSHQPKYTLSQRNQFVTHAEMLGKFSLFLKEDFIKEAKKERKRNGKSKI